METPGKPDKNFYSGNSDSASSVRRNFRSCLVSSAFANSGADEVILCDIYPARETNIYGVTSEGLAEAIAAKGTHASRAESFEAAAEIMDRDAEADDLVIVMGAGDVIRVAEILKARNKKNSE